MGSDERLSSNHSILCVACGAELGAGATFCGNCGAAISAEEPAEVVASKIEEGGGGPTTPTKSERIPASAHILEGHASVNLMPGEKVLLQSEAGTLILTTHRIRHQTESFGYARIISIMHEELASCAMLRTSYPVFLVLAALCAAGGLLITVANRGDAAPLGLGLLLALILVVLFLASRQEVVSLASSGATIRVSTRSMKRGAAKDFLDAIEAAKNARYLLLKTD